jgi:alanyl aminopeptidase
MSLRLASLLLVGSLACTHAAPVQPALSEQVPLGQLPRTVMPTSYSLSLDIDPAKDRFAGVADIAVQVSEPTNVVWLHGRDLKVTGAEYTPAGGAPLLGSYEQVHADGVARLRFPQRLAVGPGTIHLVWSAAFDTTAEGLYRVHDGDADYAFTQFEAQWARKAFPCFDEPSFKVPFDVTITAPAGQSVIANMPVAAEEQPGRFHFQPTPPLPAYLVAFAVGPFDVVKGPDIPPNEVRSQPVPLRAIATRGKGKLLGYALERTGSLVATLEKYFGIAYPYPKLDLLAVPDFGAGAMENAGAITFREILLLIDEKTAPVEQRRGFVSVTMHELAHQWFGDLVTLRWWDDVWLNEAFASWMAARAVDLWSPAEKASLDQLSRTQDAMLDDSRAAARQIRQPIHSRDDVDNAFDGITYSKGAGVISMFERWVGAETFQRGVHAYLVKHRFGSATTDDFLSAISEAAGRDVARPFHTFLDQPGVPFLDTRLNCTGPRPALDFKVSRYSPLGSSIDPKVSWQIPVCVRYASGGKLAEQCELLTSASQSLALATDHCPDWVLPNASASGYYLFGLDQQGFQRLSAMREKLSDRERMAVVQSIVFASRAGRLPFSVALSMLTPFSVNIQDRQLLNYPEGMLRFAREELVPPDLRPKVEAHLSKVLERSGALDPSVPFARLSAEQQLLLRNALGVAVDVAHDRKLRPLAVRTGMAFLAGAPPERQPFGDVLMQPAFLEIALVAAMETAPDQVFDAVVAKLRTAADPVLRRTLLSALSAAGGGYGDKARALMFDPMLRSSEAPRVLYGQAGRPATREEAWTWFKANINEVVKRFPEGVLGHLPWLGGAFCTEARAAEVEQLFTPRIAQLPGGTRPLAAVIEEIRLCAGQAKAQREDAQRFFSVGP